jgi:Cu-Zn family superoxide dismutase
MQLRGIVVVVAAMATGVGCGGSLESFSPSVQSSLLAKSGSRIEGSATFGEAGSYVKLEIVARGVPAGKHGMHIHEKGDCSAADGSSAGSHWNPTGEMHGQPGTAHHHIGDLGNVLVGENGELSFTFLSPAWRIADGTPNDVCGRALIIHGGEDDLTSQPVGNSGNRIACAVIVCSR